jgi:hypothetical protein
VLLRTVIVPRVCNKTSTHQPHAFGTWRYSSDAALCTPFLQIQAHFCRVSLRLRIEYNIYYSKHFSRNLLLAFLTHNSCVRTFRGALSASSPTPGVKGLVVWLICILPCRSHPPASWAPMCSVAERIFTVRGCWREAGPTAVKRRPLKEAAPRCRQRPKFEGLKQQGFTSLSLARRSAQHMRTSRV